MTSIVFLGIDIGGTNTKLALVNKAGRVVARKMIATSAGAGPESLFDRVADVLPSLLGSDTELAGAGIGCAGLIDAGSGMLRSSPNLPGWENTAILRRGERCLGVNTCIDNDANAAAYGEYHCGAGRRSRMLVCMTLGTGVGGGIVYAGRVLRGATNFAGEVGHMTIHERGPRCKCGNRGCLEAFVGADAIIRDARRLLRRNPRSRLNRLPDGSRLTPETIARTASAGDRVAKEVFEHAAEHLGTAIASLVNVLNPDVVALAGGVASGFDLMKKRVREVVAERAFSEAAGVVAIKRAQLGFNAASVGAALLARDASATKSPRTSRR